MNLGQKIYELRKAKNLSQGDLADILEVSRQSISKWETDASVPELDKLIRISEIFGVSIDSLVKDDINSSESEIQNNPTLIKTEENSSSISQTQKIIGIMLICAGVFSFLIFTVLGGLLSGLLFSSPFTLCGIICLLFKQRAGLWCAWAVYFIADIYLAYATSINRSQILLTFIWTEEMNFLILYFSWAWNICLAALIILTLISFRKYIMQPKSKEFIIIASVILLTLIIGIINYLTGNMITENLENREYSSMRGIISYWRVLSFINSWMKISSLITVIIKIMGYWKYRKTQQ